MNHLTVYILNRTTLATPAEIGRAVAAVRIQVDKHFGPAWGIFANVKMPKHGQKMEPWDIVIVLVDNCDDADGWHTLSKGDRPWGIVALRPEIEAGTQWTVALSHEVLEALLNRFVGWLVKFKGRYYAGEPCDCCEADEYGYKINGVLVSDFLTPRGMGMANNGPFDYCGHCKKPFHILPGGYQEIDGRMRVTNGKSLPKSKITPGSRKSRRTALLAAVLCLWASVVRGEEIPTPLAAYAPQPRIIQAGRFIYAPNLNTGSASWTLEVLTADTFKGRAERTQKFHVDANLPKELRASADDYAGSGLDIGHEAPADDFGHQADQDATFVFTNAVPQDSAMNRGVWAQLESQVRDYVAPDTTVYVYTIPLYHYPRGTTIKRAGLVVVPTDIAKCCYVERKKQPQLMAAWLCPNVTPGNVKPEHFSTTVDAIEELMQSDLFSWLPADVQEKLESGQ